TGYKHKEKDVKKKPKRQKLDSEWKAVKGQRQKQSQRTEEKSKSKVNLNKIISQKRRQP
ncbi:hypothetical protein Tco_1277689, partial [Tanacetum coccineum]